MAIKFQIPKSEYLARFFSTKRGRAVLIGLGSVAVVLIGVLIYLEVKYSRLVDERLRAGAYASTSMLFAAPQRIATGDSATADELAEALRRAGYTEKASTPVGYYTLRPNAIEVYPGPDSYFHRNPALIKFSSKHVSQIISLRDNTEIQQYSLEPELITNLFDKQRQKRRAVKYADIPLPVRNALLAAEDRRFFSHSGFDPIRVMGAVWVDIRGKRYQGASTLTMQLARTLLLDARERTWSRKLPELIITLQLESRLTKEEIFENYCNTIYLGQHGSFSIHGFGEAANAFFGKDLQKLTLPEAAMMVGQVQNPNARNPFRHPERAKQRRNVVLGMMRDAGYISAAEYEDAAATPLTIASGGPESSDAPYFVDLVNDTLQSRFQDRDFQTNSYKVYTTLDMDLQRDAVAAVQVGLKEVDAELKKKFPGYGESVPEVQVALVCIDAKTGALKAFLGGRNYAASQLDRALARRPPGSVFKPFVYTTALNTGLWNQDDPITSVSQFKDEPTTFYYGGGQTYEPGNFKDRFFGDVNVRFALTHSLNIPTVKIAEKVGYANVRDLARRSGLPMDAFATPAIALGSVGVTPLDIAGSYTIFSNRGTYVKPSFIEEVRDQSGTAIFQNTREKKGVIDARVAYLMTNLMEGVLSSGSGAGVRARGFWLPAAGKTGSSRDAWFAGFTSKLLTIVWVGFDDYRDVKTEGAKAALPIWTEFMKRAHQRRSYKTVQGFDSPDGIVSAEIDPESGELATTGCERYYSEVFIAGTQPTALCSLHGTAGSTQVTSWETTESKPAEPGAGTQPAPAEAESQPAKGGKKGSGILGKIKGVLK